MQGLGRAARTVAEDTAADTPDTGRARAGLKGLDGTVTDTLWWVVNRRRPAAQRTPERALNGLQPVYEALLGVRRQTIGSWLVRHVETYFQHKANRNACPGPI